jgi:two-component system, response regulator PdtaR
LGEGSGVAAMETIGRVAFVPHLFVTGDISAVRGLKPGAVIMQKPFGEAELTGAIRRALGAALAS